MIHRHITTLITALLTSSFLLAAASAWAVEIGDSLIREKVTEHVREKLKTLIAETDQERIQIQIPQVPGTPFQFQSAQKSDDISFQLASPLSDFYSNRIVVRVQMSDAQGASREIGVPVSITIKKPVWVVKNIIQAKQPLRPSDLKLETREVSHNYSTTVGLERDLNQYLARVNLRPGEILDARKIVIPPDVTYNGDVRILLSSPNGMTITMPGIALSDGRIGETIRVRQAAYKRKVYSARVIDKNRVLVEM